MVDENTMESQVGWAELNRTSNLNVASSIPGRAKWCCVQGTSPYLPRGGGECPCTYCKSLWIRASAKWLNVNAMTTRFHCACRQPCETQFRQKRERTLPATEVSGFSAALENTKALQRSSFSELTDREETLGLCEPTVRSVPRQNLHEWISRGQRVTAGGDGRDNTLFGVFSFTLALSWLWHISTSSPKLAQVWSSLSPDHGETRRMRRLIPAFFFCKTISDKTISFFFALP